MAKVHKFAGYEIHADFYTKVSKSWNVAVCGFKAGPLVYMRTRGTTGVDCKRCRKKLGLK